MTVPSPSPFRINLEQQRKQAKELRDAMRARHPDAMARFRRHHPHLSAEQIAGKLTRLSDAQWIIARELGTESWAALKAHVQTMAQAGITIRTQQTPPDSALETLHIRCGTDIQDTLLRAGFRGDFLAYADPLCQGPVSADDDWLEQRIAFLSTAYAPRIGLDPARLAQRRKEEEHTLRTAANRYQRVVLWFEHDSYDQLILARCLAHFSENPPHVLEMVSLEHYPGSRRFIGLGQLPEESLLLLWNARQPVTAMHCATGRDVWNALRLRDPRPLFSLIRQTAEPLPFLARALMRHCQEFPSCRNGLGLTEQLTLDIVAKQPAPYGAVFRELMERYEPLPWLGDIMFDTLADALRHAEKPALTYAPETQTLHMTSVGRELLENTRDWLHETPPERWLGGVPIGPGHPDWRWDTQRNALVLQSKRQYPQKKQF